MGRTSRKTENTTVEEKTTTIVQEEQAVESVQKEQTVEDVQEKKVVQEGNTSEQMPGASSDNAEDKEEIPPHVVKLMQLYSHYKEIWVTSRGFVHPVGVPKYLLKDAVLYKNKFYNK